MTLENDVKAKLAFDPADTVPLACKWLEIEAHIIAGAAAGRLTMMQAEDAMGGPAREAFYKAYLEKGIAGHLVEATLDAIGLYVPAVTEAPGFDGRAK